MLIVTRPVRLPLASAGPQAVSSSTVISGPVNLAATSGAGSLREVRVVVPVTSASKERAWVALHTSSRYARSVIIAKTSSTPAANSTRDVMSMADIMARTHGSRLMVECGQAQRRAGREPKEQQR